MAKRCKSLKGSNSYTSDKGNSHPVSARQREKIEAIYQNLGILFQGKNSEQAYEFIATHYDVAIGAITWKD